MPELELIGIFVLGAIAWLWMDSLKTREIAIHAARTACVAEALTLLDYTVAISNLKLARNEEDRLKLQRAYDFEFSDNGNNRLHGSIVLLGHEVVMLNLGMLVAPTVKMLH